MRSRSAALVPFALVALVTPGARAADEDPAAEAQALAELAAPLVRRGSYAEALRHLQEARKLDPSNVAVRVALADALTDTGDVAGAIDALADVADPQPPVLTRRGALLLAAGDAAGAEAALRAALALDESGLRARRLLAQVLEESGRREEALDTYLDVNRRWARSDAAESDEELLAVARARLGVARLTDDPKVSPNSVISRLEEIVRRGSASAEVLVEIGDVYLAGFQDQDAKRWYEKALEQNAHYAPALHGLARQAAFRFSDDDTKSLAERALRENPRHVPTLLMLAAYELGDGRLDAAREQVAKALEAAPADARARGARAALLYLSGDADGCDRELEAVLARNRYASAAPLVVARALEEQRRFHEALEFGKRAVAADERDWEAHFLVGRNALNVGDDALGEQHLRIAQEGDVFQNVYRWNFLELFKKMQRFPTRSDDAFVVRLPAEEDEAYYALLRSRLGSSLAGLCEKWGIEQPKPVYVSVFDQQADFATRTIGLPGFPALGACFGRVVTLDSPRALPPGQFGWYGTLHHELAHVVTLELSKGRVPRWLTEGASVYEERKHSPQWNREMERVLVDAIASDEVLTLADVDTAFRGARVMYAYYQGGLMCEFIERDFGFPKLRELVRVYGDGVDTPTAVRRALGVEPEVFDRRFLAYVKEYVAPIRVLERPSGGKMLRLSRELRKNPGDTDGWLLLAAGQVARGRRSDALASLTKLPPEFAKRSGGRVEVIRALVAEAEGRPDKSSEFAAQAIAEGADLYEMRMLLARAAVRAKDFEAAKTHLTRAIELFPQASGPDSPRVELAKLLRGEGEAQLPEAMRLLREQADVDEDAFQIRGEIAAYQRSQGDAAGELRTLLEMRDVVPLPNGDWSRSDALELHGRIAELLTAEGRSDEAELARRCAVGVARMPGAGRDDPPLEGPALADVLVDHAEALRLLGRVRDAEVRLDEALRADAQCARALELRELLRPE